MKYFWCCTKQITCSFIANNHKQEYKKNPVRNLKCEVLLKKQKIKCVDHCLF